MKKTLFIALTSLAALSAHAQITATEPWVRATVPQQKATGFFVQLQSAKDSKLVSASSPLTPTVEVHEMTMHDNIMKMRQIPALDLPAGKTVELKPGGYHVMMMNLKQQVKAGDTVPVTLVFEDPDGKQQTLEIKAPVRALNASAKGHDAHKGHDKGHDAHKH